MTIYPSHHCFDEALELIGHRLQAEPGLVGGRRLVLVHGIVLAPDTYGGLVAGEPFAHAWVEERDAGGELGVLQSGMVEGALIFYAMRFEDFAALLRPQDVTRYTPFEAYLENRRTRTYGPWIERYRLLTRDGHRDNTPVKR